MENNSQLSQVSSSPSEPVQIPEIHLEQFILDQHAKNISSLYSTPKRIQQKIFTVAQTLKDPLILNSIKPDYGSLGQFIGDINLSKDLLSQKKRKNENNDDEIEQKKSRVILKDKTIDDLNNIYINNGSNTALKKTAGKLIVESLFKDCFGMSINSFENEIEKQQILKNVKINLSNIDDIFMGKIFKISKDELNNSKKQNNKCEEDQDNCYHCFSNQFYNKFNREDILIIVQNCKNKYNTLKKIPIKDNCEIYDMLVNKNNVDGLTTRRTFEDKTDRNKLPPPGYTIETTETRFFLSKLLIRPQLMLYLMSQLPLTKLQTIDLYQVRIAEETLLFMLDIIKMFCREINKFSLRNTSIESTSHSYIETQNVVLKIKEMLEVLPLKELNLECLDFETKEFCVICLGIGSNTTLEILNFDGNAVDERGCKSLELISKHCQHLKKISLRKNYLKPHHLSYFSADAKSKIVL